MIKTLRISGILIAMFAAICLTGCGQMEEVKFGKIQGAKLINADLKKLQAEFQVVITNPNSFGFTVTKSDMDLSLNGKKLGKVKLSDRVHIKAKSDEPYTFKIESDLSESGMGGLPALLGLIQSKSPRVKLQGHLKVRTFLFFSKKIPVDVEQVIPLGK